MPRAPEKWPALFTIIHVFGDEMLLPYASGLTAPELLWELVPLTHELPLAFHYETGAEPGVRWRALEASESGVPRAAPASLQPGALGRNLK
jgi:hypothetical protein